MAQIIRTSSGMVTTTAAAIDAVLTTLRANIISNNPIRAADINSLNSLWGSFAMHSHTSLDLYGSDTYGNNAAYGAAAYDNGGAPEVLGLASYAAVPPPVGATPAAGVQILASTQNYLAALINTASGHTHTFDDRAA